MFTFLNELRFVGRPSRDQKKLFPRVDPAGARSLLC